jgi:hypothetical protein
VGYSLPSSLFPRAESASPVSLERRFHWLINLCIPLRVALELLRPLCKGPHVKLSPLLLLFAALAVLPGCAGYTKFRTTNYRGELTAEWTARGFYYPVSGGYRINAIERISGPPHMLVSRYPEGRRTNVTGPNIVRWRTNKPLWMYQLEFPAAATANRSWRETRPHRDEKLP